MCKVKEESKSTVMLFKLMTLVHVCAAFSLKCPEPAQWRLRATGHCADPSKYFCLWNDLTNGNSENCTRSEFQQPGRKAVLRGGIDAVICSIERYQPFPLKFFTNTSTNCIFWRSFCNEEGQVVYEQGNRNTDATCRCDYRQGYDFLIKPNNPCFCKPSVEDCSCYFKICSNSSHILSPDYTCIVEKDFTPVTQCPAIIYEIDNNGTRPNVTETVPTQDSTLSQTLVPRKNFSAIVVLYIFGGAIFVVLFVLFVSILWRYYFRDLRKKGPEPELRLIEGDPLILQYILPIKRHRLRLFKDEKYIAEKVNLKKNVFKIENVTQVDEGNYFAQVFYIRSRITKVTVQSMFTSEFNPISCIEGDELQLKCSVYAEDILVKWMKDNMDIEHNENTSIERDGMNHCMTFQQAKLSDAGQYSIVARNVSKQQTVTIEAMFISEFNQIHCIEGEKLQLECSVYSEAVYVEWYFQDNKKIENSKTTSIDSKGRNHSMTIQYAKLNDSGQYYIVAGNVRKQLMVTVSKDKRERTKLYRRKLAEARGESYCAQRKGIFNWKLLKINLKPIDIIDCFITSGFMERDQWDSIKKDSMRSQMDSILAYAVKNIKTSDDNDKFEKLVVKCNRNILLQTPNDKTIEVVSMYEYRLRKNRELIEKELYPKDYIDSFLVRFILSIEDHEVLRNEEDVRQQMASTFLDIIQDEAYIEKGSMQCLVDSFTEDESKVLKCLSELMLMESDLLNGNSKFIASEKLQKIMDNRNDCRKFILCKWTYLKENFDPEHMLDQLCSAGLVDEDRKEIIRGDIPRREKVFLTLRNIVRRIDGQSMFSKLKSILKKQSPFIYKELKVKAVQKELACRNEYEIKQLQLHVQQLETDLEKAFDPNYIDNLVEFNVFDVDDHEMIWDVLRRKNGGAKCFYEKISDIEYIERGSIDFLAECLISSKYKPNDRQYLARLLLSEQMPEQVKNRTKINIESKTETLCSKNTDTFTNGSLTLVFEQDNKENLENETLKHAKRSTFKEIDGVQSIPEDTKRSSVIIHLQSDGENVKFIVEKSIVNGDLTTFLMNLLDDENIKMHMSPEKKYKLSVSLHSKDQQPGSCLDPKMRIIKANRKLLEEEYDPMPLLKAVFVGNLEKYKSTENLSPEDVVDFKQRFREINKIPERRKRVKQFMNIAEDTIEADKLWELIEDTANTFCMKTMRDDLNSGQNDNSSSDEGLVFKGKYEVWKTEEDVNSPLQSFILEESKKKVLTTFVASIKITDDNFDYQLLDTQSCRYRTLSERFTTNMTLVLKSTLGFVSVKVRMFRRGSVIVDFLVTVNQTGTVPGTSNSIRQAVSTGFVGQMSVDPTCVIIENGDTGIQHEDTMSNKDFKRSKEIDLPGMRNAYELESDAEKSLIKTKGPTSKSDALYKSQEPVNEIRQTIHQSDVSINKTLAIVHQLEDNVNKTQTTVHKSEVQGIKTQDYIHESEKSVNEPRETFHKLEEPRHKAQQHVGKLETQVDFTNLRQSQVAVTKNRNPDNKSMEVLKGGVCGTVDMANLHEMMASLINHEEIIKQLLDNKADINQCRDKEDKAASPLHVACFLNNIEIVKVLLDNKEDINKCEDNRGSPLYIACQQNHIELVKLLLDNKADINKCIENGVSPLHVACFCNHIELVKVLLNNKADINMCDDDGDTPLYIACMKNHIDLVKLLIDNKADINTCKATGASPLTVACYENHIETVKILLKRKADINKWDGNGASALYITCQNNHKEIVKLLIDNKADINKCADNGASPLNVACQNNHVELVKVLLENKADINKCDAKGATALYMACQNNHKEVVKLLLDNKADINACDDLGGPLYIACQQNYIELVKILLDNKADINKCRANGVPPLNVACLNNHIETVKILLDNEADINKCDDNGATALYMASQNNQKEVVQLLLDNKADINKCTHNGASPLNVACQNNHLELVKVLLENNADINTSDRKGATALYMACQNNHKDVVKLLLDNKADISAGDDLGGPLYIACQQNHIEVVKILLDNKADINKCRANGASPLNVACQNNHIETVKILLDNKADVTKRDDNGATALYMASQNNHKEVVQLLLAHNKADTQNEISDRGSLHIACRNNHKDTFKILLDNKADINKCNGNGATALYMAFQNNHQE